MRTTFINPILSVEQLEISSHVMEKPSPIVKDVTFQLYSGEMLALTGPSGCGKSLTAQAVVGLLERECKVTYGNIYYKSENILDYDVKSWQMLRRSDIALLIQHSLNGLNPFRTVKKQMVETMNQNKKWPRKEGNIYLHSILHQVGFSDPDDILSAYPFELSGGMRQRVLLAMMISLKPKILIADEPTTALDVINREKVLTLLKELQYKFEMAILLISHDYENINKYADRVIKMDQGGSII
ncbi:ABC transporter ATP-binding protein [Cytobacillus horneckiae]|uniref:ATP-binding cassette domain-containing protein n=1 Tax=Cytobacillus horneckiae TaxID=549687 RepID=UPI0034CDCC9F